MISDEELECMASTEAQNSTVAVVRTVAEMAAELLAYREAERKASSWDDAPEWANCRAKDQHCEWIYLELRPYSEPPTFDPPPLFDVPVDYQSTVVRWIATLERRPK